MVGTPTTFKRCSTCTHAGCAYATSHERRRRVSGGGDPHRLRSGLFCIPLGAGVFDVNRTSRGDHGGIIARHDNGVLLQERESRPEGNDRRGFWRGPAAIGRWARGCYHRWGAAEGGSVRKRDTPIRAVHLCRRSAPESSEGLRSRDRRPLTAFWTCWRCAHTVRAQDETQRGPRLSVNLAMR